MKCAGRYRDEWTRAQSSEIEQLPAVHLSGKIVVSRENYRQLPDILAFAQSFRLDSYHIRLVDNFEPGQEVALTEQQVQDLRVLAQQSSDPLLKQFGEFLLRRQCQRAICPKFSLRFGLNAIIETNGDVFLSIPSDGQSQFSIGNINRDRLSHIWGSSKHKEVIKRLEALTIPVSRDRHHKIDMAINEHVTGRRKYQFTREMLTKRNFRLFQRAQI
jgi:MoaA/NifB/PqqE/SkfB family radical SAM enzyme